MRLVRIASIALACGAAAYALPPAQAAWGDHGDRPGHESFCSDEKFGDKIAEIHKEHADTLARRLKLTDAQKAAFKDAQDVRVKAMTEGRAAICAAKPAELSFDKRLEFRQARLQARLDALKAEAPKLLAFYNSLNERQKGQFDEISRHESHGPLDVTTGDTHDEMGPPPRDKD
ncbi:Spy/CpxP family protein refolding chaperone [Rhodoblastus sphagnicola]|nr:Spy/CpxP family protein refolding chaperone [Rhodoblastus sphagnicola]MBB4199179.1 Spy/CpxP family protein refolding chaperone [Rhodoblastus sphagnicola]